MEGVRPKARGHAADVNGAENAAATRHAGLPKKVKLGMGGIPWRTRHACIVALPLNGQVVASAAL
jgi:hypothetical protein